MKEKQLAFYHLFLHRSDRLRAPDPEVNWVQRLQDAGEGGLIAFKGANTVHYEAQHSPTSPGAMVLGRAVDSASYQVREAGGFAPVAGVATENYLARVNVAAFFPFNAFAVVGAPAEAPQALAVAELANHLAPRKEGRWQSRPIVAEGELDRFQRVTRVSKVSLRASVQPHDLFSEPDGSLASIARTVGDALDSQFDISLQIKVRRGQGNENPQRRLRGLVDRWHRSGVPTDRLDVSPLDDEYQAELLRLVSHNLTEKVLLPDHPDPETLCQAVSMVCADQAARVRESLAKANQR